MNSLRFFVEGIPAPKGSKKAFTRMNTTAVQMVESSKKLPAWEAAVEAAAREALLYSDSWEPHTSAPVVIDIDFYLPEPKRIPVERRGRPTTKPDIDKLMRGVLDPLTVAGVWRDDSVVIGGCPFKLYGSPTGALISVRELPHATAGAAAA